mgnify:CR=1 FL=1
MPQKWSAFFYLVFTFFIWSNNYIGGKVIAEAVPPSVLAMIRSFIGTSCLFWMARKELKTPIDQKDRKWFFLLACWLICNVPDGAAWYQIGWGFHGSPHQFHQPRCDYTPSRVHS